MPKGEKQTRVAARNRAAVLGFVLENPGTHVREISDALELHRQTIEKHVTDLIGGGRFSWDTLRGRRCLWVETSWE